MSLSEKIAVYLEDIETPLGMAVNLTVISLIFLSLVMFVTETYSLPESVEVWLHRIDFFILIIFALEYFIRCWCAGDKIKFVFSLFSVLDLLAIVPLFIGIMDTRFIRIFRWFRLLRIIRFISIETSLFRIQAEDSLILARISLILFSITFCYSGLIYQIEHQDHPEVFRNFFDALYFSIVTMTTVGFGDVIPLSETGRLLTILMILTGIILIPWQVSDLIKQLIKTTSPIRKICSCGLSLHDRDANFCKICGAKLEN
jgi:voltage-gated potassium channel